MRKSISVAPSQFQLTQFNNVRSEREIICLVDKIDQAAELDL